MQHCLLKGHQQESLSNKKKNVFFFLKSSDSDSNRYQEESQSKMPSQKLSVAEKNVTSNEAVLINTHSLSKTEKLDPSEKNLFRVLTINYLAHLIIFTYAGWMGR